MYDKPLLIPVEQVGHETRLHWSVYVAAVLWFLVSLIFFGFGLWFIGAPLLILAAFVGVKWGVLGGISPPERVYKRVFSRLLTQSRPALLVTGVALPAFFLVCPLRLVVIDGRSMEPSLHNQQVCWFFRSGPLSTPNRGDVICFRHDGEVMVKRIRKAPGDRLTVLAYADNSDSAVLEPRAAALLRRAWKPRSPWRVEERMLGQGEYFVVGDNTTTSLDSRHFGPVDAGDLLGTVIGGD